MNRMWRNKHFRRKIFTSAHWIGSKGDISCEEAKINRYIFKKLAKTEKRSNLDQRTATIQPRRHAAAAAISHSEQPLGSDAAPPPSD